MNEETSKLIPVEQEANEVRMLGLQAIYAMKADCYQMSIEDGRLLTLDCFMMIGDYADHPMDEEWAVAYIEHERKRVIDQADFVGAYLVKYLGGSKEAS